jgi:putative endonuclease
MEAYYIYALESEIDGRIYVGISEDPERRLMEHNCGKTKSTKGYRPWKLFFTRQTSNRREARELEKYYKSGSGKEKLKIILKEMVS